MSTGKIPWDQAYRMAQRVHELLEPHVVRSKCVGSLRRRQPEVGDIEFVVEPRMIQVDLLGEQGPDLAPIHGVLREHAVRVKGADRMLQYGELFGWPGVQLELYLAWPPAEWGSLVAIRTGPWQLGVACMKSLRARGYRHIHGHVEKGGEVIPTPTEADFFDLAGVELVVPHERDALAETLNQRNTA